MRRAAKIDGNHSSIVSALRQAGCFVQSLAAVGKGCPDLLVGRANRWHLLEVKNDQMPPSRQRMTSLEEQWALAASHHAPIHVVRNVTQALQAVGL